MVQQECSEAKTRGSQMVDQINNLEGRIEILTLEKAEEARFHA